MALISASEIRAAEAQKTDETYGYVRRYLVRFDANATAKEARDATGIPAVGDAHPEASGARVIRKNAAQVGDSLLAYTVEVEYSSSQARTSDYNDTPTSRSPEIRYSTTLTSKVITRGRLIGHYAAGLIPLASAGAGDVEDDALVNSAYDRFEDPVEADSSRLVLLYTRWYSSIDPNVLLDYSNAINSDVWPMPRTSVSAPIGTAKIMSISADSVYEGGGQYWLLTYEIHFQQSWNLELLNVGMQYYNGGYSASADKFRFLDDDGEPVSTPQLLTTAGGALSAAAAPTYAVFQIYKARPFVPLALTDF